MTIMNLVVLVLFGLLSKVSCSYTVTCYTYYSDVEQAFRRDSEVLFTKISDIWQCGQTHLLMPSMADSIGYRTCIRSLNLPASYSDRLCFFFNREFETYPNFYEAIKDAGTSACTNLDSRSRGPRSSSINTVTLFGGSIPSTPPYQRSNVERFPSASPVRPIRSTPPVRSVSSMNTSGSFDFGDFNDPEDNGSASYNGPRSSNINRLNDPINSRPSHNTIDSYTVPDHYTVSVIDDYDSFLSDQDFTITGPPTINSSTTSPPPTSSSLIRRSPPRPINSSSPSMRSSSPPSPSVASYPNVDDTIDKAFSTFKVLMIVFSVIFVLVVIAAVYLLYKHHYKQAENRDNETVVTYLDNEATTYPVVQPSQPTYTPEASGASSYHQTSQPPPYESLNYSSYQDDESNQPPNYESFKSRPFDSKEK